ncbi:MAG: FtsQ-type POTRA domain-containing protein [Firmicutes bacterium]|nr:FtsQ-type POTRA domain-containing protein [Bacillota bacterium]MBQ3112527.1 FtsQ-type POTRA domain-containing protein [Bacillota bacterium]
MERRRSDITDIGLYRRRRRRSYMLRWLVMLVFLICVGVGGFFLARSPIFDIAEIRITGNDRVSDEQIIKLSRVDLGMSVFAVEEDVMEKWIAIEPRIKAVEATYRLPNKLRIVVEERQAVALVDGGDGHFLAVDESGRVLERLDVLEGLKLPLLLGITSFPKGVGPGYTIEGEQIEAGMRIINSLESNFMGEVGEIDVGNVQDIYLYTNAGLEIRLGDSADIREKFLMYQAIVANAEENGRLSRIAYVDVRLTDKPVINYW